MKSLLFSFVQKIVSHGLADQESVLFLAVDDEIYSYSGSRVQPIEVPLRRVFDLMNINSLLYAVPGEPIQSIIGSLVNFNTGQCVIIPEDCETRTFFHDVPVIDSDKPEVIAQALSRRKSAVIQKSGAPLAIVSYGTVSPEQAFVSFSSTCFSTFVKYFYDHLMYLEESGQKGIIADRLRIEQFKVISSTLEDVSRSRRTLPLMSGPAETGEDILDMIVEAGMRLISDGLVDSFFGNISSFYKGIIYVSETAASLDGLKGAIDAVPVDGSSSVGITSSSEYATHRAVYRNTPAGFILHGHPRFSVIMSMICLRTCELRGQCHRACKEKRHLSGVPIVPGEIGTGPTGIVNTVPRAFRENDAVIVFGHGVFTIGETDFNKPYARMSAIEAAARDAYFRRARELSLSNGL